MVLGKLILVGVIVLSIILIVGVSRMNTDNFMNYFNPSQESNDGIASDPNETNHPPKNSNHSSEGTDSSDAGTNSAGKGNLEPKDSAENTSKTEENAEPTPNVNDSQKDHTFVRVMPAKLTLEEDYTAMAALVLSPITNGVNPDTEVARATVDLVFENIGNSSVPYAKFDSVFYIDGLEIKSIPGEIGSLEPGQKSRKQYTYTVKMSDIPAHAIDKIASKLIEGKHPVFSFKIKMNV